MFVFPQEWTKGEVVCSKPTECMCNLPVKKLIYYAEEHGFCILMLSCFVYLETIKKTLGAGGNVLLPVDTVGRVLELILTLEQVSREYALF